LPWTRYNSELEAAHAFDQTSACLFGDLALTNFQLKGAQLGDTPISSRVRRIKEKQDQYWKAQQHEQMGQLLGVSFKEQQEYLQGSVSASLKTMPQHKQQHNVPMLRASISSMPAQDQAPGAAADPAGRNPLATACTVAEDLERDVRGIRALQRAGSRGTGMETCQDHSSRVSCILLFLGC
jgi:hypothetical protein